MLATRTKYRYGVWCNFIVLIITVDNNNLYEI